MLNVLETARLVLRPLQDDDVGVLVEELNNFAIARNTARIPRPYHRSDALEFLAFAKAGNGRSRVSAVEEKSRPGRLIGVISYEWSEAKGDAELGYWYCEAVWGRGFGSEAARAMVDDAFSVVQHSALVACHHSDNPASARILAKVGFETIGACTSFSKAQGKDVDVTNMRLTRPRWLAQKTLAT
jgi:[ribosomal protein S5]-alanine N-acetyltransferase